MKYHVNDNDEVNKCSASIQQCQYGESSHFIDRTEAVRESESRLEQKHQSKLGGVRKSPLRSSLMKHRASRRSREIVRNLMSKGYEVTVASPERGQRQHGESSCIDILDHNPESDRKLLNDISNRRVSAFA